MTSRARIAGWMVPALTVGLLIVCAVRHQRALAWAEAVARDSAARRTALATVSDFAGRQGGLGAALPQDLLPVVHATLASCSLPASTCTACRLLRDEEIAPSLHRREHELVFTDVTPGQVGAILAGLAGVQPRLRTDELRLEHQEAGASSLDRNRFRCTVRVSSAGEANRP